MYDVTTKGTGSVAPVDALPGFRRAAWVLVVAAAALHATIISRAEPLQSANDRSRWCTIWSLLNRGSYQIDEIRERPGWNTIDLVRIDGHFYSTKPPLMSTWVAGVAWGVCRLTGWNLDDHLSQVNVVVLLLVNAVPFAVSLGLLVRLLAGWCPSEWTAWFVLVTASFGTLLSPFLTTLNNHTMAAAGVMAAMYVWLRPARGRPSSRVDFAVWGFSSAWAACHDLPAAAFAAWMAVCAWRRDRAAAWGGFLPAALVPVGAFLVTNYAATGSWQPAYAGYGGESYRFVHQGIPSYWTQPQGIDRNLDSPPVYLMHCLVGHHGWFSLTPAWLLVVAAVRSRPKRAWQPQWEQASVVRVTWALTAVILGFYLTRTHNYNYGGVSCGLRWALLLVPMWTVSLVPAVECCARSAWGRGAAIALLAASIYSAWEPAGRAWQQPWLFRTMERWGWIDYRDRPPDLPRRTYSWLTSLPETNGRPVFVELQRRAPFGDEERLRVEWTGDVHVRSRRCAAVKFTWSRGSMVQRQRQLLIDRAAFGEGRPPAACLVWIDSQITPAQQQADLALYRGLPLLQAYHPGFIRYLKSPLRTDALPCQRIAAQVRHAREPTKTPLVYRSDVWVCDEVPFGVARVDWTVSEPDTAVIVQQESWQVVDCSPPVSPTSPVTVDHLPPFPRQPLDR